MIWSSAKQHVRTWLRAVQLRRAIARIAALPLATVPDRADLVALRDAWSNPGFAAVEEYLEEVARRAVAARIGVLECGSGVTTILAGLLAGRRGVPVWSLEHDPVWLERLSHTIARFRIPGVHLCHAPLVDRGDYAWYQVPADLPPRFDLVVCDGPPGSTPGGRYGLLPVVGDRLGADCLILVDDTARVEESDALRRWRTEFKVAVDFGARPGGSYALVTRPALQ